MAAPFNGQIIQQQFKISSGINLNAKNYGIKLLRIYLFILLRGYKTDARKKNYSKQDYYINEIEQIYPDGVYIYDNKPALPP